ncbi:MAG: flagellar M-ring protein FliF [Holosporales bacterium]|jgi:flagellar M-ring protein FliF|nr:flagellar M-ring protein FliF [Holosporales bacterium]
MPRQENRQKFPMVNVLNVIKDRQKIPLFALWGGSIAIISLFIILCVFSRSSGSEKRILFNELDLAESSQITKKLESLSIPFEIRADGQQILVNAEDIARARMNLAGEGLPTGGSIGYEVFDKSDAFSATSFVQDVNHTRALEGELVRSIVTLDTIARARVHLVLAKNSLFKTEQQKPTASVVLKLKNGARLKDTQIQAIQNLVAGAVPNLSVDNVTIIDDQGTLLTCAGGDSRNGTARNFEELRSGQETRLARSLEALLSRTVGVGKVRVEVAIEMDFDHFSENKEIFDPDGQVVRSKQIIEDGTHSADISDKTRATTVENALPNDRKAKVDLSAGSTSKTQKTEEIFNYEISKTTRSLVRETGIIRRISVAVLVDGTYKRKQGELVYTPRATTELGQLKTLVKSAIGFKSDRGDVVEIVNLRFSKEEADNADAIEEVAIQTGEQKASLLVFALLVGVIILAVFLLYPFRPSRSVANVPKEVSVDDLAQREKPFEAPHRKDLYGKIKELIDRDPETVAAIIETWLQRKM